MNLENKRVKDTYLGIINMGETGMNASYQEITDGAGVNLGVQVSTSGTKLTKANLFAANLPGPYTSDADFYSNYSGGTAGQLYLITVDGKTAITVAGNN